MGKNIAIAVLAVIAIALYADMSSVNSHLISETDKATSLNGQVSTLNTQVSTLNDQLTACQSKPTPTPNTQTDVQGITVGFGKPDPLSNENGEMATITNQLSDSQAIHVDIARPGTALTLSKDYVLDQSKQEVIDENAGWAFVPGDTLTISESGHNPLVWTVKAD